MSPSDLVPPLDEALMALLRRPLHALVRPPQANGQGRSIAVDGARKRPLPFARFGRGGVTQRGPFAQQELLESQGEAAEEVPAVGYLHGVGGTRLDALPADVR